MKHIPQVEKVNLIDWVKNDYIHSFLEFKDQNLSKFKHT